MGLDHPRVSNTVAAALSGPGGVALVVKVFAGLPGVTHTPAQRGLFSKSPERIQIGDWRYEVAGDGRLRAHWQSLISRLADLGPEEIGRRFGGRDHTTVLHAVRKIEALAQTDGALRDEIELLKRMLQD